MDSGWEMTGTDSVRPWCGFGFQLEGDWQDSVYTAEIEYPELVRISEDMLGKWGLSTEQVPLWPVIQTSIGESRGSACFNAGFVPVIRRDGSFYVINSFKSIIKSAPGKLMGAPAYPDSNYTRRSVLSNGKWVKIRVSESGVHKITAKALKSMVEFL